MERFDPVYWDSEWDWLDERPEPGKWKWASLGAYVRRGREELVFLWTWDGNDEDPKWMGWLKSTHAIRLDEVKALARTQQGVILVTQKSSVPILATIERLPGSRSIKKVHQPDD